MNRFLKLIGQLISARPSIFNRISKKALLTPIVDHPSLEFLKTTQFSKRLNHFPHTETFHIKKHRYSSLLTETSRKWLENDLNEEEKIEILDQQQNIISIQNDEIDILNNVRDRLRNTRDMQKKNIVIKQNTIEIQQKNIINQKYTVLRWQLLYIVLLVSSVLRLML